jgi:hypothetical protein
VDSLAWQRHRIAESAGKTKYCATTPAAKNIKNNTKNCYYAVDNLLIKEKIAILNK